MTPDEIRETNEASLLALHEKQARLLPRRITIDAELNDGDYERLLRRATTLAEMLTDNFDISAGPSPDDACYPHSLAVTADVGRLDESFFRKRVPRRGVPR